PDALELAKRFDDLLAVHDRQELAARLSVTVLAGERAAVGADHVRRFVHEALPRRDALGGVEREVDAAVDAGLAEMAVERGVVAVLVVERAEVAHVRAE